MRIVTINKSNLQSSPIPRYIQVSGCEIYVTYQGQVITCKYYGNAGLVPSESHKRATDFPALTRSKLNESSTVVPKTNVHPEPVNKKKKDLTIRVRRNEYSIYYKLNSNTKTT